MPSYAALRRGCLGESGAGLGRLTRKEGPTSSAGGSLAVFSSSLRTAEAATMGGHLANHLGNLFYFINCVLRIQYRSAVEYAHMSVISADLRLHSTVLRTM